jgi:SAM-dependent methyltransferase
VIVPPSVLPFIRLQRTGISPAHYGEVIAAEYEELAPYLPERTAAVLDIGCGVAGIDVHLARRYPDALLYLLDRTERAERIPYGFGDRSFYSSLEAARELMVANGVDPARVETIEAPGGELPRVDLVVSLLALGFHIPVGAYLDRLRLSPGGRVVLDLRVGTGGAAAMAERLALVGVVRRDAKAERTAWCASAGTP